MIEKEIILTLNTSKRDFISLISSPLNLPRFWKYLKEIKIISSDEYIAKFKVFMNFILK